MRDNLTNFTLWVCLDITYFAENLKLKIENNKKITVHMWVLFICLFALFMSHEHCKRRWAEKKKRKPKTLNADAQNAQYKQILYRNSINLTFLPKSFIFIFLVMNFKNLWNKCRQIDLYLYAICASSATLDSLKHREWAQNIEVFPNLRCQLLAP